MDLGITGKTALITGAARGLGRADAERLAQEGCKVAVIDIQEDGAESTAEFLRASGARAVGFATDITDRDAVNAMIERIEKELGPVDILVNNAATLDNMAQLGRMRDELWDRDVAVNLTGTYNVTKAVFPGMCERGWGRIVFMASIAGLMGGFGQASYAATKMAMVGFCRTVALEGARQGVTANVVAPGIIGTEAFQAIPDKMKDRMRTMVAMQREGEPGNIADTIAFLCSDRAEFITGTVLPVTGGMDLFVF